MAVSAFRNCTELVIHWLGACLLGKVPSLLKPQHRRGCWQWRNAVREIRGEFTTGIR